MEIFTYPLFTPHEVASILKSIEDEVWGQGVTLNPEMALKVKFNKEIQFKDAPVTLKRVMDRISSTTKIQEDTLIRKILPPKFNMYSGEGQYKRHSDAPYMDVKMGDGRVETVRTDYSMTLFLTEGYEGGELVIEGEARIKGPIGSCVIYPSDSIHYVTPVTEGERICVITWMESRVKNKEERGILRDLRSTMISLEMFSEEQTNLSSIHGRLTRKWSV